MAHANRNGEPDDRIGHLEHERENDFGVSTHERLAQAALSADLADAFHEHGQRAPGKPGPLHLQLCFPRAGVYRLWAQLQRRGIVHTARFTVLVSPMGATADR